MVDLPSPPSPNNLGSQAQDSNTPEIPNPTAGSAPVVIQLTAIQKLQKILAHFWY